MQSSQVENFLLNFFFVILQDSSPMSCPTHCTTKWHIFCTEIEIRNCRSHDISQKLRQTKCLLFNFGRLKCTIIPKKPFGTWQFGKIGVLINLIIQKLKSKRLVCLGFWDMSCDLQFRISISVQKIGPQEHCAINVVTIQ